MSSSVTCFDYIIGLTRTPCSDYTGLSADYTTSDSGLYLDELIPIDKYESILNCKVGENVFTFMEKARDNAIIDFRIDATAILTQYNTLVRNPFKGRIGKVKRSDVLTLVTGNYYGIVLRFDDIVGGEIVVTDIGTIFDTTAAFNVLVYNNLNDLVATVAVTSTADVLTLTSTTLSLPTHSDYVENLEYYFIFQYNGTNTPYDNVFRDTCGSLCNARRSQSNKQFGFTDYMSVSGISLTSIADFSDVSICSENRCFGLTLGLYARCKVEDIWCYDEMDYVGNAVDMAIAKCIRLKAASNLIRDIALTSNLNFDSMIDGVTLGTMDEQWNGEYNEMIDFIVKNIDITKTDCFECGREILGGVGSILS